MAKKSGDQKTRDEIKSAYSARIRTIGSDLEQKAGPLLAKAPQELKVGLQDLIDDIHHKVALWQDYNCPY